MLSFPFRIPSCSAIRKTSVVSSLSLAALLFSSPFAHAGIWQFTITGSGSSTTNPSQSIPDWKAPSPQNGMTSYGASTGGGTGPGMSILLHAHATVTFHVAVAWVPSGTLASDPMPSTLRVTEAGAPTATAGGSFGTGTSSATLTGFTSGTHQYAMPGGFTARDVTFTGDAAITIAPPVGGPGGGGSVMTSFNYSISAGQNMAAVTVDQDQQIFAPAPTTRLSATISNAPGFTVDWIKISVDGGGATPAVVPVGSLAGYIDWPQAGGNPSEHTVTATAQIHDSTGPLLLNSLNPPGATGAGRAADDIIADVHLQSIKFNSNITLSQDAVTPVPTPELTWTGGNASPTTANPAAYIQGKSVNFTMLLGSSAGKALTGTATMGYGLKLQATPNTTNPSTKQPDPALTLYDNTSASPFVPKSCTVSTTIAATTALNSWVSQYTTSFSALMFYVKFTKLPSPYWVPVSSYGGSTGNILYATVAAPAAPMASPWVAVLSDACDWAKRTSDAASATTALVSGEYNNFTYDGNIVYTDLVPLKAAQDGQEIFNLQHFLNNTAGTRYSLTGDCRTFADFLCCASGSIGALSLQVQRSSSAAMINNSPNCSFSTNYGFQAHPVAGQYDENVVWHFHQWAVFSSIYDGAFQLATDQTKPKVYPTALTPLISSSITDFYNKLVEKNVPICWNPQTVFSPTVAN